jgi:hypothetical protein
MLNINGMVKVPWKLQFTGIFRAQTSQHRTMLIRMHLGERYKLHLYLRCSIYSIAAIQPRFNSFPSSLLRWVRSLRGYLEVKDRWISISNSDSRQRKLICCMAFGLS